MSVPTCEEVTDFLDEVSELVVGVLHFGLGVVGLVQGCLGLPLCLHRLHLGLGHLRSNNEILSGENAIPIHQILTLNCKTVTNYATDTTVSISILLHNIYTVWL